MLNSFRSWVERVLEKPFYEAELMRVEILKKYNSGGRPTKGELEVNLKGLQLNHK
ncbi:MAG: hypothetical protein ACOY30_03140 [Bacillota bacterium]